MDYHLKTLATVVAIALTAALPDVGMAAAAWQPIGNGQNKVEIDRSRIARGGEGVFTVWSRLALPKTAEDAEGAYNSIEVLSRYDCPGNRFTIVKRIYLLDTKLTRIETVLSPKPIPAAAGSVDAAVIADVCNTGAGEKKSAIANLSSDLGKLPDTLSGGLQLVSESAAAKPAAAPSASPSAAPPARLFTMPRIDPSMVQHPTDEPKPAEVAKQAGDAGAVRSEAAKAGVSLDAKKSTMPKSERHALEMALATSGLKRNSARRAAGEPSPEAEKHAAQHKDIHWSYEGEGGPNRWSRLRPDYSLCETGQRQSPIDIHEGIRVDLEPIKFDYHNSMFRIIDNGHTVQVNVGEGNTISIMGRTYRLVQLHFHRPAEERIEGRGFEMVMHMVHQDDAGRLAVVAVLIEPGAEHPLIQTFWNNLPLETNLELAPTTLIDVNKLLPETRTYYTYMGSLTTPPCTEGVLWMVLKQPLQMSPEQILIFSRLYRNNARPIQPANGRLIKDSR